MTSKQVLLHIGPGKTGTTSIQETLRHAAENGQLEGFCYPRLGHQDHNFIAALYRPLERIPRGMRGRYRTKGPEILAQDARLFREDLARAISENQKVVISAEFLTNFAPKEVEELRADLMGLGVDEILVLAYFRSPESLYLSTVQQELKAAGTFSSPARWQHPIGRALKVWGEKFPDLLVRPFVRDLLVGGDAVSDFLHVASSFFGLPGDLSIPIVSRNQSVSSEGMLLLQRYRQRFYPTEDNTYKWDSTKLAELIQRSVDDIPQTRPRLGSSARQLVASRHVEVLESVANRYGIELPVDRVDHAGRVREPDGSEFGRERLDDVSRILEDYDEATVQELALFCAKEALTGQADNTAERISQLQRELDTARNDAASTDEELQQVKVRLEETLASSSWRWGHRAALVLSSPRRLVRAIRGR